MIGLAVVVVSFLGLLSGFTGLTYPLTVVGLLLCTVGTISPLYAILLAPIGFVHYTRMQNPLTTPPGLRRTGLIPVLGLAGAILTSVVVVQQAGWIASAIYFTLCFVTNSVTQKYRNTQIAMALATWLMLGLLLFSHGDVPTAVTFGLGILVMGLLMYFTDYRRNKRLSKALASNLAEQLIALVNETGRIMSQDDTREKKIQQLYPLMERREILLQGLRSQGIDPDDVLEAYVQEHIPENVF